MPTKKAPIIDSDIDVGNGELRYYAICPFCEVECGVTMLEDGSFPYDGDDEGDNVSGCWHYVSVSQDADGKPYEMVFHATYIGIEK